MNEELKDLQNLWQSQKADANAYEGLIQSLNQNAAKSRRERRIIVLLFPLTLAALLSLLLILPYSPLYYLGIGLITLAMLMVIYLVYRHKVRPPSGEQALNNKAFLADYIEKLKGRKRITSHYMWIYTLLLVLGINIGYIDVLRPAGPTFRILAHLLVTLILPIGNYFGIKKRLARYEEELDPLISQLEEIEQE